MKKSLMVIILLCTVFMVTGCENILEKDDDSKLSVYEFHYYDSSFNHTEEMVVKYNDEGELVYAEAYWIADNFNVNYGCEYYEEKFKEFDDAKYEDVKFECEMSETKRTLKYIITDKSLKDGYLQNEDDSYHTYFNGYYDTINKEENFKKYLEEQIEYLRDNNLFEDERNYIIIDGEKTNS